MYNTYSYCIILYIVVQVDNMLAWGNGVANEYYEYKIPSDFKRPMTDQAAEKFIRLVHGLIGILCVCVWQRIQKIYVRANVSFHV